MRDDSKGSWIWRKLLKLRDLAYEFMKVEVRNGETTYFWFDNWMGSGRLIDVTGAIGTTYLGLPRSALVSNAVSGDGWSLRNKRSRRFQSLNTQILAEPLPDTSRGTDLILWRHKEDGFRDMFPTANTWNQIRPKKAKVDWSKVVWFTQSIPRYSFITWLAVLNRLATGDIGLGESHKAVDCVEKEMRFEITCSLIVHILTRYGKG